MRRPAPHKQKVTARYFTWVVWNRAGTYYADGRGNSPKLGRFSLAAGTLDVALVNLEKLDRLKAVEHGKAHRSVLETANPILTLADGRKLYETHISRPDVTGGTRRSTQKRYRAVLDKFLAFAATISIESWAQVNRSVLERYAQHLEGLGKSYNTQYLELTTLKQINKWLIGEGHLPETCRLQMRLTRHKETTTYCWTMPEFQAIVAHCRSTIELAWLGDVCLTLGLTGMRISELAQLRWSNLNFDTGMIGLVDESRCRSIRRAGHVQRTLKNKRGRSFPMNEQLVPVLQQLDRHRDGFVFHGPKGGRLKPDTVRRILINAVLEPLKNTFPAEAGEQGFVNGRLHSFRHFFCSQCANSGVPERVLQDWLGHADAAMVRRYYHLDAQESRRQMDRVAIPVMSVSNIADAVQVEEETTSPDLTQPESSATV
jgi:integrase